MGIQDRDYYRRETSGSLWLTGETPVARGLVVVNIIVFVIQMLDLKGPGWGWITFELELTPSRVFQHFEIWRLLTATFCHGGFWHILWNMLLLWWLGGEVEKLYGSREFLIFYGVAAVFSSLAYAVVAWYSGSNVPAIGASGAVAAVAVLYTLYNPRHQVYIYGIFPIEMRWIVIIYLGMDAYLFLKAPGYSPVAHMCHLGGAAYAVIFKYADLRISRLFARRSGRPRLRVVTPDPEPSLPESHPLDQALEHRMDEVLAKIARQGQESLSAEERDILEQASQRLRNRRG